MGNDKVIPYLIDKYNVTKGVIGIGDNFMRYKIFKKIKTISKNFNFVSCIHPSAIVASFVILGSGNVIMPGVTINTGAVIKNHCILNTNSSCRPR